MNAMTPLIDLDSLGYQGRVAALLGADALSPRAGLRLPMHCAALVTGEAMPTRVASGGEPIARNGLRELLVFATGRVPITWSVDGLTSSDGYGCTAEIAIEIAVIAEASELLSLRRRLLDRPGVLTSVQIADVFRSRVTEVVRQNVELTTAAELVGGKAEAKVGAAISEALQPDLFASGLSLGRVVRVQIASSTYAAVRTEEQRAGILKRQADTDLELRKAALAARQLQVAGLESMLQKLMQLAQAQPGVTLRELIRTFDPAQRGELYAGLLSASQPTGRPQFAVVVAGHELFWFDPAEPREPVRRIAIDSALGALRSVRLQRLTDGPAILVGAARGVHWLNANGDVIRSYVFEPSRPLRGGVNAAAIVGDRVLATHSEVGLISWPRGDATSATFALADVTRGASTVRDVRADIDGAAWFAVGPAVIAWKPGDAAPTAQRHLPGRVESLLVGDTLVAAGLDDGRVLTWPRVLADRSEARMIRPPTGDGVHSLGLIHASGIDRLLVADGRPLLDLLVADDTYRVEYQAPEPVRWGWAAPDIVVGASERRDRLFVWPTREPSAPAATIQVGRLCGHSIQDALLIPAATTA